MTLRRAGLPDAPRLAALAQWVWLDSYAADGVDTAFMPYLQATFSPDAFARLLTDPTRVLWVQEEGRALQGLAQLCRSAAPPVAGAGDACSVELERLYVAPSCTSRGLGVQLMAAARATWPTQGLWLTVWDGNSGAQRFYDREGGRVIGEADFLLDGQAHRNLVYAWPAP